MGDGDGSTREAPEIAGRAAVVALLALLVLQAAVSAWRHAATFDEPFRLGVGYYALSDAPKPEYLWHGNPPLSCWIGSLLFPFVRPPSDFWTEPVRDYYANGLRLMYDGGADPQWLLFLCRMPMIAVALATAWLVARWASSLAGPRAGLLALALYTLSPTTTAYAGLLTSDFPLASATLAVLWLASRYWGSPTAGRSVALGAGLGLALIAKLTALFLVPVLAVGTVIFVRKRRIPVHAVDLARVGGMALFILWAGHAFETGPVTNSAERPHAPIDRSLAGWPRLRTRAEWVAENVPVPCPSYWKTLQWVADKEDRGTPVYLQGRVSSEGFRGYYFVALGVKTPIPLLLLALAGAAGAWPLIRRHPAVFFALAGGVGVFMAMGSLSRTQLGIRYILPIEPAAAVWAGAGLARFGERFRCRIPSLVMIALLGWLAVENVRWAPHHLEYFNSLAGGPQEGWRMLADSNLDWGQDLTELRRIQERHGLQPLYLDYFGTERPGRRGVVAEPMPDGPLPRGFVAVSANYLAGLYTRSPDRYATLRDREPWGRAGYSILIYDLR